jgi:hypothetical protein
MTAPHQNTTALGGQCDVAKDAPDSVEEDQLLGDLEEVSYPKGSVPLHRLDETPSPERRDFDPTGRELEPCTLGELAKYQKSCHFCEIVCSGMEDFDNTVSQDLVTFRLWESRGYEALLYMDVLLNGDPGSLQIICIKSFTCELCPFASKCLS